MTTSVLMSTYIKEKPKYLDAAMKSIWTDQTCKPDQIVLVEDGVLTKELYDIIEKWRLDIGHAFCVVKNKQNQGLAKALNDGLRLCTGDIIIRMDTDDIAMPTRIEEQMNFLETHKNIQVVGAWIQEFIDSTDHVVSIRKTPETPDQIFRGAKTRNPMNHPTVAFRKDIVTLNGGYTHFLLFEDYCLWVQLLMKGVQFYNIQKPLLYFRISKDLYARRGGYIYAMSEIKLQRYFCKIGFISRIEMLKNCTVRFLGRFIPNDVRGFIYKRFLR